MIPARQYDLARAGFEAAVELASCEIIKIFDKDGALRRDYLIDLGAELAGVMDCIAQKLAEDAPVANAGAFLDWCKNKYGIYPQVVFKLLGVADVSEITDFHAAQERIKEARTHAAGG